MNFPLFILQSVEIEAPESFLRINYYKRSYWDARRELSPGGITVAGSVADIQPQDLKPVRRRIANATSAQVLLTDFIENSRLRPKIGRRDGNKTPLRLHCERPYLIQGGSRIYCREEKTIAPKALMAPAVETAGP